MTHTLNSKTDESMKCRVFIGNLPSENITKDTLKNIFAQYGSYLDCSIYKNFGFVQYNDEQSANNAVQGTNKTMMFDRRLDVKIATVGRKDGTAPQPGIIKPKKRSLNLKEVRPLMSRQPYDPNAQYPPQQQSPQLQPPVYQMLNYEATQYQSPINQSLSYPTDRTPRNISNVAPTNFTPNVAPNSAESKLCEIICSAKKQLSYAEYIEYTMNKLGFVCNINLLGSNYAPEKILNRASNDGVSFAVSLKDDNESHRSINLHIFTGNHEEHRNMPLDVAENFIKKKFASSASQVPPIQINAPTSQSSVFKNYNVLAETMNTSQTSASSSFSYPPVFSPMNYYPGYRQPLTPDSCYQMHNAPGYSQIGANAHFPPISPYQA
ncbi:hypothetical protein HZS_5667, partial [Henneguya salminicola]